MLTGEYKQLGKSLGLSCFILFFNFNELTNLFLKVLKFE